MQGSIVMDAGVDVYRQHLLKMVDIMLEHVPASGGIVFDQTGLLNAAINLQLDNVKRTFVEQHDASVAGGPVTRGRAGQTQIESFLVVTEAVGDRLRSSGRAMMWNPTFPRIDLAQHQDGFFGEMGQLYGELHLNALLGVGGKPLVSWNAGCSPSPVVEPLCSRWSHRNTTYELSRLLYWGSQPMLPLERNDHSITRWQAEHSSDLRSLLSFGPLFRELRQRRWLLVARAATVVSGTAAVNAFETPTQYVIPVVLAAPEAAVIVEVRLPPGHAAHDAALLLPGPAAKRHGIAAVATEGSARQYVVNVGPEGCGMLLISKSSKTEVL